jgi:hypothetical protein
MAGKHIHLHLHKTADVGTSAGARKAAQTRAHGGGQFTNPNTASAHAAAHSYHKNAAGFPISHQGHSQAAALHQHARHAQENKNPMFAGRADEASKKAWAASTALGYKPQ